MALRLVWVFGFSGLLRGTGLRPRLSHLSLRMAYSNFDFSDYLANIKPEHSTVRLVNDSGDQIAWIAANTAESSRESVLICSPPLTLARRPSGQLRLERIHRREGLGSW